MIAPRSLRRRLEALTSHQRYWIGAGLATEPADRPCAEAAALLLYEALGRERPRRYVWLASPGEAMARYEDDGGFPLLPRAVAILPATFEPMAASSMGGWDLGDEARWHVWHCVGRHVVARLTREAATGNPELAWFSQLDAASLAAVAIRATGGRAGAVLDAYEMLAESAGFAFATTGICYLSERPSVLRLDERGRLHAEDGPALVYPDGWALHAWHGEIVSPRAVGPPERLTVEDVHAARNVELRRHLIARMGYERYLAASRATSIHRDDCGELYRIDFRDDEPLVVVHVVNTTPEPDGTRRRYTLRVPPTVRTAREAVAWTFGLGAEDYGPDAES